LIALTSYYTSVSVL